MLPSIFYVAALAGASLLRVQQREPQGGDGVHWLKPALAFQMHPPVRSQRRPALAFQVHPRMRSHRRERVARARRPVANASPAAVDAAVPGNLGLLPFPVEEALLPGETKQVHLFEARFLQLFSDASRNGSERPRMAALLVLPGGYASSVTTLFEVEEWRRKEVGVWAQLRCTGRVRMVDVRQSDYEYAVGNVEPYMDNPAADPEPRKNASFLNNGGQVPVGTAERKTQSAGELPEPLVEEVVQVHDQVAAMYRKLAANESDAARKEPVEWGHELRDAGTEAGAPLEELLASRTAVLKSRGLDALPAPSLLEAVEWGDLDDAAAWRQLLSFTAAAALPPGVRIQILQMQNTTERLRYVLHALEKKQQRFAALTALRSAADG